MPTVAVVVPTYNRSQLLERCVNSVLAGIEAHDSVAGRAHLFVVDDGSTLPQAKKVLRRLDSRKRSPHLTVLRTERNSGTASGPRNLALDVIDADYVLFLDSDDYLGHEALPRLLDILDSHEPDYIFLDQVIEGNRSDGSSLFGETYTENDLLFALRSLIATRVFRMDVIRKIGLRFDEYLKMGEDVLFTLTFMVNASRFGFAGAYDYYHKTEHSSRSEDQHQSRKGLGQGISFYQKVLYHAHILQKGLVEIAVAPLTDEQKHQAAFQVLIPRTIKETRRFLKDVDGADRQLGAFTALSNSLRSPLVNPEGAAAMRQEAQHFFHCAVNRDLEGYLGSA